MAAAKKPGDGKDSLISENRRGRFDYEILETLEAGIELKGVEVKSLRDRTVSFADAYAIVQDGELVLRGLKIQRYKQASTIEELDPDRTRRLLVNKKELERLQKLIREKGYSIVPMKLYFKGPWVKVLLGIGRGKTHGDKRETIRAREADREVARVMRRG